MAVHEFEDMPSQEWPNALRALKEATQQAWATIATLENLTDSAQWVTWSPVEDRGIYFELTGRAYTLLRDLRAEGMRQLAKWEESQKAEEEEEEYQRKRIENWNAVADGLQPPHPSEY